MRCRVPREVPFAMILVKRVENPAQPPGPGALIKQCSLCEQDVWVAPLTVEVTGLRAPLVCRQCLHAMAEEVNKNGMDPGVNT